MSRRFLTGDGHVAGVVGGGSVRGHPGLIYLAAAVLGGLGFLVLSLLRAEGFATYGQIPLGDAAQALNALSLFAEDPAWRWPLFTLHHPGRDQIESLILADGIPLYALAVKLLTQLGLQPPLLLTWRLLAMVGQAVVMTWLLRGMGVRRPVLLLLGAGLALLMPAYLFRGHANHLALSAHAVAIAGVAAYFAFRTAPGRTGAPGWTLLLVASLLVHPYFLAMNAAVFAGWLVQRAAVDRAWRTVAVALGLVSLGVACAAWAGGYIAAANVTANEVAGFGHFSMNLLSPVAVTQGWFVPGEPILDATGGQYEGYNYLGLGVLGLLALALVGQRRTAPRAIARNCGLVAAAVGLTVFAASQAVYFGPWRIADLSVVFDPISTLSEMFRSSGRFFWPVGYLLLGVAVAGVAGVWPRRFGASVALALGVFAVQAADVSPMAQRWFDTPTSGFNHPDWQRVFRQHVRLQVHPVSGCTRTYEERFINPEYAYAARRAGLTTNTYPAARSDDNCGAGVAALQTGELAPGTLYLFHDSVTTRAQVMEVLGADVCRRFRESFVCSGRMPRIAPVPFFEPLR